VNDHDPCDRAPCRALRAGIGPPPWTAEQWQVMYPPTDDTADDPIKNDPDVLKATGERDTAREAYDLVDELWLQAVQVQARAQLRGRLDPHRSYALQKAVDDAAKRRDTAWSRVIRANTALATAQRTVQRRLELAEANR
jgi:hypothetical protein